NVLAPVINGRDPCAIPMLWSEMVGAVRNIGWRGIAACAISAVDVALWDLKAQLVGLPLVSLLGMERERVPVYGSGGFTSYPNDRLREQLGGWGLARWLPRRQNEDWARSRAGHQASSCGARGDR